MKTTLTMTGRQHERLQAHLFPGDGLEAVALLLCGRRAGDVHRLLVHDVVLLPHDRCERERNLITWPTELLDEHLERAAKRGLAVVKIHSHPGGFDSFSPQDDNADKALFLSIYSWVDRPEPHGSAIMLPDGRVFGRVVTESAEFIDLDCVVVVGDDITIWPATQTEVDLPHGVRFAQMFGKGTLAAMHNLKVAVVGCSGTGTLVIEGLVRNCVGHVVLVDPDEVADLNLNRMVNTKKKDVGHPKVDVLEEAILAMDLGTKVTAIAKDLFDPDVVRAVADCDVIFGCVDNIEARHLLNRLAAFYLIPLFDVGVRISADGLGGVDGVEAAANYVAPDGPSLMSRGMYTQKQLDAAMLAARDPEEYKPRRAEGYIDGVDESESAVISVNMMAVALGLNDFLARLHPYRDADNAEFARQYMSLYLGCYGREELREPDGALVKCVGRGDTLPLLQMPALSERR